MIEIIKEGKMWIGDIKLLPTLEHLPQLSPTSHSTQRDFMPLSRFMHPQLKPLSCSSFSVRCCGGKSEKNMDRYGFHGFDSRCILSGPLYMSP